MGVETAVTSEQAVPPPQSPQSLQQETAYLLFAFT